MKTVAAALAVAVLCALPGAALARATAAPTVRVKGKTLVDGRGRPLRLLGVNRSGAEYACVQGWGIFDGPTDARAVAAMKRWRINIVRVPLNEECWLGVGGWDPRYTGRAYRDSISAYVRRLHAAGLAVVLDLHWSGTGAERGDATEQHVMPGTRAVEFWRSVAATFRSDRSVLFDLYNEPHDVSWQCWRDGCTTSEGWRAAGMQSLVDAVRSTGARQPILVGGLGYASDLTRWTTWAPRDPARQLVASFHIYNFSGCRTVTCWTSTVKRVSRSVPVVTGELGEDDCAHRFVDRYMRWADKARVSYLGWAWNVGGCRTWPSLIRSYDGRPTPYGAGLRTHLAQLAKKRR